ncbi:MAG TPA: GNAT family protein [Thermodesulfobacteriota bacterium]|nr:GNAT family protein [Thermodesulfobacteriota bacterium]
MLVSELLDMIKPKIARFEPCIREEDFVLRRYELKDIFALRPLFNPELFLSANGLERRAFGSFFSFFRWMVTTFQVFYVCEIEVPRRCRVVGFVGIYDLEIGRSLYLAIAVFNPEDRGRGYGSRAVRLLLNYLNKHGVAERVCVEVLKTNLESLRFFEKLGFEVCGQDKDTLLLERSLSTPILN